MRLIQFIPRTPHPTDRDRQVNAHQLANPKTHQRTSGRLGFGTMVALAVWVHVPRV